MPLLLALVTYYMSVQNSRSVAATLATDGLIQSLDELLSTVQDAETGQRGYLLTRSEDYLTPYIRAKGEVYRKFSNVVSRAAHAGVNPMRCETLKAAIDGKMLELDRTVKLQQNGKTKEALAQVETNAGQQLMARIRRLIGNLKNEQITTFEARYERQQSGQRYLDGVVALGVALSIILLLLAFRLGTLYVGERNEADLEMQRVNELLESRVKQRTAELEARTRQLEAQALELKRSNADLIQFASIASHDLQEPLRTIASYMGMLVRRYGGSLDETAQTYIQFAISGASRMQTLVNDLLAYSRVGTQGIAKRRMPFEQIVKRVVEGLELMIRENSAKIVCGSLPTIEADEVKISQVLQNLVGNAIKFRKAETPPEIRISAERQGGEWQFAVSDNGIGFDPKYCDRIFEVFQRLHGVGKYSGNGIGLAISRRIIEHHGGRLWAESTPDVGSTFYFTLPAVEEPANQHQPGTIVQEGSPRAHVTRSYAS